MLLAVEASAKTAWILLSFGILGLILGISSTLFFIRFKKIKKIQKDNFNVTPGKYKIFRFWQYYAILTLAMVGYLAALILISISIEQLVNL